MEPEKTKVVGIAEKANNSLLVNPEVMLRELLADIESGKLKTRKLIVVLVDDNSGHFDVGFRACQLRGSEVVASMEFCKNLVMRIMGYP